MHSESFANTSASNALSVNLATRTASASANSRLALTVSYDSSNGSYTLTAGDRSQTFDAASLDPSGTSVFSEYVKIDGSRRNRLILTRELTSRSGVGPSTKYVGAGYWQRDQISGSLQTTTFDVFTYGVPTTATAVPRTGSATYAFDIFGLLVIPGFALNSIKGVGVLSADFAAGQLYAEANPTQYNLETGDGASGGLPKLLAAARLSSTDGAFSGNLSYEFVYIPPVGAGGVKLLAGPIQGGLFGPGGQEFGATFSADNAEGITLSGGFTGARTSSVTPKNLSVANIVERQLMFVDAAGISAATHLVPSGGYSGDSFAARGQFTLIPDGSYIYAPGLSSMKAATFNATDRRSVPLAPNFVSYEKSLDGEKMQLSLYTPGASNTQLALTYSGIGLWKQASETGPRTHRAFFDYGIVTPKGALTRRTGTARYNGVIHGAAFRYTPVTEYTVSGTSQLNANFSDQTITGAMTLIANDDATGTIRDFGAFQLSGPMESTGNTLRVVKDGIGLGEMKTKFYGPDGEELAGTFRLLFQNGAPTSTDISGVMAAKRE